MGVSSGQGVVLATRTWRVNVTVAVAEYIKCRAWIMFFICQFWAIDEMMLKLTTRMCALKQLIPNKPIDVGLKKYEQWCARTQGIAGASLTIRARATRSEAWQKLKRVRLHAHPRRFARRTVRFHELCDLCHNYFSSITLFVALAVRGIWAVGMVKHWKPKKARWYRVHRILLQSTENPWSACLRKAGCGGLFA